MELQGFETRAVDVTSLVDGLVARFAHAMFGRWPNALISRGWSNNDWTSDLSATLAELATTDALFLVRDAQMLDHFNEFSYTPMADGEGGVSLSFSPIGERLLYLGDGSGEPVQVLAPSRMRGLWLVTPEHIDSPGFSKDVYELFLSLY